MICHMSSKIDVKSSDADLIVPFFICAADRESKEHDDTIKTDMTEDQMHPAKVPLLKQDMINSKKAQAMQKDRKKQQEKLRSMGQTNYSPLPIDKHEPEYVSPSGVAGSWDHWRSLA